MDTQFSGWKLTILLLAGLMLLGGTTLLGGDDIRAVQSRLQELGYDPGPIDGIWGPLTEGAVVRFQEDSGLEANGRLNEETMDKLGVDTSTAYLPSGLRIDTRLNERLDSGETREGASFSLTVSKPVRLRNQVAVPEGSLIRGTVTEVESAGRPQKSGRMVLRPDSLVVRGETLLMTGVITAEGKELEGEGSLEEDLKKIGIAAGVGAVLGGLIEGDEGLLAGLLIGGGGTFLGTKGGQVELPPETPLVVELKEGLSVPLER